MWAKSPLVLVTLAGFLGADFAAWGDTRWGSVPGSRYPSARGAALGDAFLPFADDGAGGLFYNPAALGRIRYTQFEPFNFSVDATSGYINNFGITDFYKITSLQSNEAVIGKTENLDKWFGGGAMLAPTFFTRGLAFGVLAQTRFSAMEDSSGVVHYKSLYQLIPAAGGALRLASGVLRIGYTLQWVNQASGTFAVPRTNSPLGYNQGLAQASGFSHNLGFALTLPFTYLPALNVVARNVFGLKFKSKSLYSFAQNPSGVPADEPMTLDGSLSIQPRLGAGAKVNMVLQLRDAMDKSGMSLFGRLCAGLELDFRGNLFLRGGWGSGYPSAGVGLKQKKGEFGLTWSNEEVGGSYHAEKDTRFQLHYQVRAF